MINFGRENDCWTAFGQRFVVTVPGKFTTTKSPGSKMFRSKVLLHLHLYQVFQWRKSAMSSSVQKSLYPARVARPTEGAEGEPAHREVERRGMGAQARTELAPPCKCLGLLTPTDPPPAIIPPKPGRAGGAKAADGRLSCRTPPALPDAPRLSRSP